MKLSIYSIQSTLFEGEVENITLPTAVGEITILDNHIPLVSLVKQGEIRYTLSGTLNRLNFQGGIMEVRPGSEVVLLEKAGNI